MSNIWFTSDTHFGHKNIVKACSDWPDKHNCRDFGSIEDHDSYLINEINRCVKSTDTLYHLGDFGFGHGLKYKIPELRGRISCQDIRLLLGNHDHAIETAFSDKPIKDSEKEVFAAIRNCFKWAKYLKFGKIGGRSLVLCHYAMRTFPWQHHGAIMLYAHSHSSLPDDPNALSMDIGVDTCLFGHPKYTPYSIEEIFHIMDNYKKFAPVDHHKDKSVNPC